MLVMLFMAPSRPRQDDNWGWWFGKLKLITSETQFTIIEKTLGYRSCLRVREWRESHCRNLRMFDLTSLLITFGFDDSLSDRADFTSVTFITSVLYLDHVWCCFFDCFIRFLHYAMYNVSMWCIIIALIRC